MGKEHEHIAVLRAARGILLDGDPASLRTTLDELGVDAEQLIRQGRAVIGHAIGSVEATEGTADHHEALRALVRLLRRRDNLSEAQLAERARVDLAEIRRIESDATSTPLPRTIYQLEQVFQLPKRSLVKLAGMTGQQSSEFTEEVVRFAAKANTMEKLTTEEKKILNAFVRFLSSNTDPEAE